MEELKKEVKKMKAITLIALVITMIVLIILAAIVINLSLGNNGIFNRTKQAKENYQVSVNDEQVQLANAGKIDSSRDAATAANPAGTIISYYGKTAPEGYLACDGTEYNISDYSALAELIKTTTGSYGTETVGKFKVPNLSGKFLKGNTTENIGNEEEAGLPDITGQFSCWWSAIQAQTGAFYGSNLTHSPSNQCSYDSRNFYDLTLFSASRSNSIYGKSTTVTPENISVLYCIKY